MRRTEAVTSRGTAKLRPQWERLKRWQREDCVPRFVSGLSSLPSVGLRFALVSTTVSSIERRVLPPVVQVHRDSHQVHC